MVQRIAINTSGGDAPGLNAVVRAATLSALRAGLDVLGIRGGYTGLLNEEVAGEPGVFRLDAQAVRGIGHLGGTILGTTFRGAPYGLHPPLPPGSDDREALADLIVSRARALGIDAVITIGGDGSLQSASGLHRRGLPVVGVPKTIDNDLEATDTTFGFQTAVETATDAIGRLHSTAEAHQRVMVVELMGRHAGWIALEAGLAGGADVILIPEIPYRLQAVVERILEREEARQRFSIVVAAEGARPREGLPSLIRGTQRYGGIADHLAVELAAATGKETRALVLGHIQRGGSPIAYDRNLATRLGVAAVRAVLEGRLGHMVAIQGTSVGSVPLERAIRDIKRVPLDSDAVVAARQLGISFGE